MRKITQTSFGQPDVLHLVETDSPVPGPGEILVRIAAAGVNPVDVAVRAGLYPLLGEPPFTVGWDVAGVVRALGPGVTDFAVGDRVFGMPRFPGQAAAYAEEAAVPAADMAATPAALDDAAAGALPLAGLTAWRALVTVGAVAPGQRVLIHGAAGGVGHLAVQIAKARGAHVTATASAGKLDFLRTLGADVAIDHGAQDFAASGPFDLVLDPLDGAHVERSIAATRPGGAVVALLDPGASALTLARARDVRLTAILVEPDRQGLEALADLAARGKLSVTVSARYPLADAARAQAHLATRPLGKIVLLPGQDAPDPGGAE